MVSKFRTWLRPDMRVMRWVFLTLYVTLLAGLVLLGLRGDDQDITLWMATVILASQTLFILGAGTVNLCKPIRRRRLWVPVAVAAAMLASLATGALFALTEFLSWDAGEHMLQGRGFWLFLGAAWLIWGALLWVYVKDVPRIQVLRKLARVAFVGSLAEMVASVPAHVIVSRRPGCMVGIGTGIGIIAGMCVMLFSFGPAIVMLFLRPRYRREKTEAGENGREAATQAALSSGSG